MRRIVQINIDITRCNGKILPVYITSNMPKSDHENLTVAIIEANIKIYKLLEEGYICGDIKEEVNGKLYTGRWDTIAYARTSI